MFPLCLFDHPKEKLSFPIKILPVKDFVNLDRINKSKFSHNKIHGNLMTEVWFWVTEGNWSSQFRSKDKYEALGTKVTVLGS